MQVEASVPKGFTGSYFDLCGKLKLRADSEEEATWMAALASVITDGGELVIRPKVGKGPVEVEFDSVWERPGQADEFSGIAARGRSGAGGGEQTSP